MYEKKGGLFFFINGPLDFGESQKPAYMPKATTWEE